MSPPTNQPAVTTVPALLLAVASTWSWFAPCVLLGRGASSGDTVQFLQVQSMPEVLPELQVPWAQFDGQGGLSPKHPSRISQDIIAEYAMQPESKADVGGSSVLCPSA
jgi:hypothetical protein